MEMLAKKEQIWLNIECKDTNGMSAMRIAIAQGYAGNYSINYIVCYSDESKVFSTLVWD